MGIKIYINPPKNVYEEQNIKRKLQGLLLNCSPQVHTELMNFFTM